MLWYVFFFFLLFDLNFPFPPGFGPFLLRFADAIGIKPNQAYKNLFSLPYPMIYCYILEQGHYRHVSLERCTVN